MTDTTTLIQKAANKAKPSQDDAAALVRHLAAHVPDDSREFDYLASLYTYFLPAQTTDTSHLAQDAFTWVAAATDPDSETRDYASYVHATGDVLVATDGKRLHMVSDIRTPGFYDPNTGAYIDDADGVRFPYFSHLLDRPDYTGYLNALNRKTVSELKAQNSLLAEISLEGQDADASMYISERYLDEALAPANWATDTAGICFDENRERKLRVDIDAFGGAVAIIMGVQW